MTKYDASLMEYCTTDRQREMFQALLKHKSYRLAAEEVGLKTHQPVADI